ncbi:MAG: hypothetical protein ACFFB5_18745 [Promethearchaeota archaeon]
MQIKSMHITIGFFLIFFTSVGLIQLNSIDSLTKIQVAEQPDIEYSSFKDIICVQSVKNYLDAYANYIIEGLSTWYLYGENALGPPDNNYALIYQDYGNGYLVLDMDFRQEIINGTGSDFTIIAGDGDYLVRVGNNFTSPFVILGTGSGNQSFDLSTVGLISARYVWIECISEETVELDAIEAIYYNQPDYETDLPQITGPDDFWVWSDQKTVQISWEVYDLNPWNYSISVENITVEQLPWEESLITYNLDLMNRNNSLKITLILDDIFGNRAKDTVTIELRSKPPSGYLDAYANWFLEGLSTWYLYGENALGSPDDKLAVIYIDYGNGYLVLDMGLNQEIINGTGSDFTVIAGDGDYLVRVGNNFTSPFVILGTGSGNQSFDLSAVGLTSARYIWIECISEEKNVELDAIEAIYYNQPDYETDLPQITGPDDFWVWSDQKTVQISWEVYDLNPWNYSVSVENIMVEQSSWEESSVSYKLGLTDKNETVEIVLVLDDIFGNRAKDTVTIELRSRPSSTESSAQTSETGSDGTSNPNASNFPLISLLSGFSLILLFRKRTN